MPGPQTQHKGTVYGDDENAPKPGTRPAGAPQTAARPPADLTQPSPPAHDFLLTLARSNGVPRFPPPRIPAHPGGPSPGVWGVFIIAVHRAFVLGLGARHRGFVELSNGVVR